MKKVLITGQNSYIGSYFQKYVKRYSEYKIDTVDMQNESWINKDFFNYDVIFHVAGIVHQKENKNNRELFYKVNRDLAIDVAKKAKREGVKQIVLMSTMNVYGKTVGTIDLETVPDAKSAYGKSKSEADDIILKLDTAQFKVAIIRPPMVYGKGCKGNFKRLSKFIQRFPIFSRINNKRSVIYIDNLCEFIHRIIEKKMSGIFLPQNKKYISTEEMVCYMANVHGKRIVNINIMKKLLKILNSNMYNKIFGDLVYKQIDYGFDYHIVKDIKESIEKSIK